MNICVYLIPKRVNCQVQCLMSSGRIFFILSFKGASERVYSAVVIDFWVFVLFGILCRTRIKLSVISPGCEINQCRRIRNLESLGHYFHYFVRVFVSFSGLLTCIPLQRENGAHCASQFPWNHGSDHLQVIIENSSQLDGYWLIIQSSLVLIGRAKAAEDKGFALKYKESVI